MQKFNNIIISTAIFLATVMMSVSCLEKEDLAPGVQNVMIELSVSAESLTKSSPTVSESAINSLRIYAFYGERLAGYASRGTVVEDEPFYMDLELPATGTHDVQRYYFQQYCIFTAGCSSGTGTQCSRYCKRTRLHFSPARCL